MKNNLRVVFISYDRASRALVGPVAEDIRALGFTVWFDQELTGGQLWWDKILENIRACDVFIPCMTPRSLTSTACERELAYADALRRLIMPVLAADGVSTNLLPTRLASRQFVDYRTRDRNTALRLARSFLELPSPSPLPNPLPDPPEVPGSYLGELAERVASSSSLTYEQQSALLLDLKTSLRDNDTAEDARSLLQRFRKRRDLLALIAQDIDELLMPATPKLQPDFRATGAVSAGDSGLFAVILKTVGPLRINVIKVIREVTDLGLKEAKDLVDAAPSTVKESVSKVDAEIVKKKLMEVGATVEVKRL